MQTPQNSNKVEIAQRYYSLCAVIWKVIATDTHRLQVLTMSPPHLGTLTQYKTKSWIDVDLLSRRRNQHWTDHILRKGDNAIESTIPDQAKSASPYNFVS